MICFQGFKGFSCLVTVFRESKGVNGILMGSKGVSGIIGDSKGFYDILRDVVGISGIWMLSF